VVLHVRVVIRAVSPTGGWSLTSAGETDVHELLLGRILGELAGAGAKRLPFRLEVDVRRVAPSWVHGFRDPEGHFTPGEHRFEQLFTVPGIVSVDGGTTSFTGGGLSIHRRGGSCGSDVDVDGHVWDRSLP